MENNRVSIIVPCYNQAEYLPETLDSVFAQTYSDWECIIVNDGSRDNTEDVVKDYCDKDSRFKYLKQENQGLSMARNNGIRLSSGNYILPLDADDLIAPTYLEKAVNYLESHQDCKLVYCQAEYFGKWKGYWQLEEYKYEKFIWRNCIFCSFVYRRSDYDLTNGYNPTIKSGLEDWDFLLSFLRPQDTVYRINEVLFKYRVKKESMTVDMWHAGIDNVYKQIYHNHPEIYSQYSDTLIWLHCQLSIKEDMLRMKTEELDGIKNSKSFKLIERLQSSIVKIKQFVKKHI